MSGLNFPGSESMTFHGIFWCSFKNLTVTYSGKDVFTSSSHVYSQDQVCNSNHAECVLFSQSLVPRCNTKAYFYSTILDAISFATILNSLYVRSLWNLKSCALIQRPTDWLGSQLQIALDPRLKLTFAVSWMKAMLSKMPLNYQRSRFTWRNYGCARSLYGCSLWASSSFGGVVRSHVRAARKRRWRCKGQEREEEFSSLHSIDLSYFFSAMFLKVRQKFMAGQPEAQVSSIIINCVSCSSASGILLHLSKAEPA